MFTGTFVAMVTPFAQGKIDEVTVRRLVRFLVDGGVEGLVPSGTTGEGSALSDSEFQQLLTIVMDETSGKVPVIAGCGSNATDKTIQRALLARDCGVNALLVVTPYYVKPTQEGLRRHFMVIADKAAVPVILYNVPSRTGCDLLPDTIAALSAHPMIVGVKEATGSLRRACELLQRLPDDFSLLSGDDFTALPFVLVGGHGVISVAANIVPESFSQMIRSALQGDITRAREINLKLFDIMDSLFWESNPIPVKKALQFCGIGNGEPRLPLVPLSEASALRLRELLLHSGVIKN